MASASSSYDDVFDAVSSNNIEYLRRSLHTHRGLLTSAYNSQGWTLLHAAVYKGNVNCAKLILSNQTQKLDVNVPAKKDSEWTPLHLSVNAQVEESVKLLITYGAKVNILDKQNRSPLHLAAAGGSVEIVKLLLDADADTSIVDYKGRTPYHVAVQYEAKDIATLLRNVMRAEGHPPTDGPVDVAGADNNNNNNNNAKKPPVGGVAKKESGNARENISNNQKKIVSRDPSPGAAGMNKDKGAGEEEPAAQLSIEDMEKELEAELAKVIGLEEVKNVLRGFLKQIKVDMKRAKFGFESNSVMNMVFLGPPGTGKTSIARIVGKLLKTFGLLKKGTMIEVSRKDLVGEFAGSSAKQTSAAVEKALGGVLFIDEAYSLKHEGSKDSFGQEVIDCLVGEIEKHRSEIVVILAGYTKEMTSFLNSNQGLDSRFPLKINFPSYSYPDLAEIFLVMLEQKKMMLDDAVTKDKLVNILSKNIPKQTAAKGNARAIKNFLDQCLRKQTERVAPSATTSRASLMTLKEEDLQGSNIGESETSKKKINDVMADLDKVIGLDNVKKFIKSLRAQLTIRAERELHGLPVDQSGASLHMIFVGNPGTGKTTIARKLGDMFASLGVLSRGQMVEVSRADLVGEHMGETSIKTLKVVDRAMGGVLFVDEAYGLVRDQKDSFGYEALDTLMKAMEDNRDDLIVILAGYPNEMTKLCEQNPGLKSRFPVTLEFKDYSAEELMKIAEGMLASRGMTLTEPATARLLDLCRKKATQNDPQGGNARYVRNVIELAGRNQAERLVEKTSRSKEDLTTFTDTDIQDIE